MKISCHAAGAGIPKRSKGGALPVKEHNMAQRWQLLENRAASFHILELEFSQGITNGESAKNRFLVVDDEVDSFGYVQEHLVEVVDNMLKV
jgi:hypothetical protein